MSNIRELASRPRANGRYWLVRHMLAPLWRHYMQAGVEAAARVAEDR